MSTAKLCDRKVLTQRKGRGEGEKEAEKAVRAALYSLKVLVWLLVLEKLRHGPQRDKNNYFVTEFDQVSVLLPSYSAINNGMRMTPYLLGYLPLSPLSSHTLQFFSAR